MRVGIIGLGGAGKMHLGAWRATEGIEVVAACDPMLATRRWARSEGLRAFTDPIEMVERAQLDIVSICTPPMQHAPVAIACLEAGVHVLCEKPLTITTGTALRMLRAASRTDRHLLMATKFRHVHDLRAARELIAAGEIGEPVAFEIDFSSKVDMSTRWNSRRMLSGGGVVIDNGCHALDIVTFLFDPVSRVQATRLKSLQDIAVEDSATMLVAAGKGLIGRIEVSWSLNTLRETYVTVYGSKATIEIGWRGSRLRVAGEPAREIGPGYDKHVAHQQMMAAFRDLVVGKGRPWISPGEVMRTVAAVEAAYRSMRTGGWVNVDMKGLRGDRIRREMSA